MNPIPKLQSRKVASQARSKVPVKRQSPSPVSAKSFFIVGIGASAGGLEAFTLLLKSLPPDTGFGFVLVQHLDPQHESALTQILARATSMPVREITRNLKVEANHVYVIPPNTNLSIEQGLLKLAPRQDTGGGRRSIDSFFESLAQDQGERSIGVILSGTATDGTLGLEAIKAEGGITFAQDDSAKYDSMPRSASAAGCVDFVLSPKKIAKELARIATHPYIAGQVPEIGIPEEDRAFATKHDKDDTALPSGGSGTPSTGARQARAESEEKRSNSAGSAFKKILLLLHNHCGVDFSLYKSTTIQRRVTRRVVLNKQNSLDHYAKFLRGNTHELDALYSDCLISVTSFFRNPEAFDILKRKVFPKLLHRRGDNPFRVWVLGCSTGQEAYSIAMTFLEAADKTRSMCKLQVFATDLNEALLNKARIGLYAKSLAQDISPERLKRFFVEEDGGYRIVKPLREMVVFARQNLVTDPPFSRMDLISCRNLLIYIEPGLQRKIMPMFHYALKPEGFLFLGASESVGTFTDLFEPADKKYKIFTKKAAPPQMLHLPVKQPAGRPLPGKKSPHSPQVERRAAPTEFSAQREADRITITQYAPPGVLINSELQILQFRGPTSAYLQPPSTGKASFDVLKMAKEGLMLPLRTAINKAKKDNASVRTPNVRMRQKGKVRLVDLEVIPLKNLHEGCFLILFHETEAKKSPAFNERLGTKRELSLFKKKEQSRRMAAADQELAETRDYLRSMQEQHEASNEELQASSEELQSANEELQSINEELETSKEELESANEELITVNEEMASRNTELARLNSDLTNLQSSTKLPIIVVGRDLTLRRFSPAAEKMFNLLEVDIGRPIGGIRHNLDLPDLEQFIADVISDVREQEREVRDKADSWYSLRVRPYMTVDNKIDGAVLVLVDITALKHAQLETKSARDYAEATVQTARDPLIILRADLRINSGNEAFYKTFRTSAAETEGHLIFELGNHQWNVPKLRTLLEEILPLNTSFNNFEVIHEFPDIGIRTMLLNGRRLDQANGKEALILLAIEDVTDRQRASQVTTQLAAIVQTSSDAIFSRTLEGVITSWNPGAERMYGYEAQEILGKNMSLLIPAARAGEPKRLIESLRHGEVLTDFETEGLRKNGSIVSISLSLAPLLDARSNQLVGASVIARNISERKQAEQALQTAHALLTNEAAHLEALVQDRTTTLQETIAELEHFSYTITHDMRAPLRTMTGYAGMLLEDTDNRLTSQSANYLGRIVKGAYRMDTLICDSLQYAKIVREKLPLEVVQPLTILRDIVETYSVLQPPGVQIELIEPFPAVRVNEAGLAQCFSNLLLNAVKFVAPGVTPTIRVRAEVKDPAPATSEEAKLKPVDSRVRFWFEDNGVGIPLEHQGRIFEMFQQLDKNYEGTGIGLALVRKTAERMGGKAGVESEPGKGSRFWLEFNSATL